jgi:hypothetical protein
MELNLHTPYPYSPFPPLLLWRGLRPTARLQSLRFCFGGLDAAHLLGAVSSPGWCGVIGISAGIHLPRRRFRLPDGAT